MPGVKKQLKWLVGFYPKHIAKEDKGFFIPAMSYFSGDEQDTILKDFLGFDRSGIQEKYRKIIEKAEKKIGIGSGNVD